VAKRRFPWRESKASIYKRIVAEVLLQRTRAESVAAYWDTFFDRYPTWRALAEAPVPDLERALRPIGLSRQRAPRLHGLSDVLARNRGRFPRERHVVEGLPGVGQYIANAIMLFCHGKSYPLIDVNMARVFERVFGRRRLADIRDDQFLQTLAMEFVRHKRARDLNWAVLDLGALVCKARNPRCDSCPLANSCRYFSAKVRTRSHTPSNDS
jgi:A/G-specific adenine glycosylase